MRCEIRITWLHVFLTVIIMNVGIVGLMIGAMYFMFSEVTSKYELGSEYTNQRTDETNGNVGILFQNQSADNWWHL